MLTEANLMNFERTDAELETLLLFSVAVAGKNSQITMRSVNQMLAGHEDAPFTYLRSVIKKRQLLPLMKKVGMGQFKKNGKAILDMATREIDLRTCTVDELESIHGVGPKTARFFLAFSRKNVKVAILDVHILRWMKRHGIRTPAATPSSKRQYRILEEKYLALAKRMKQNPAKLDYKVWLSSRKPINVGTAVAQS